MAKRERNNHIITVLWVGTQPNNIWDKISCPVLTEILTLLLMLVFDLSLGLARSEICHDCLKNLQCSDNKKCTKCHHESNNHPSRDYKHQPTLKILLILIFNQPRTMTGQVINTMFLVFPLFCVRNRYIFIAPPYRPTGARYDIKSFVIQNNIYILRNYQLLGVCVLCHVLCAICLCACVCT